MWTPESLALLRDLRGWTERAITSLELEYDEHAGTVKIPIVDETGCSLGELAYLPDPALRNGRSQMRQPAGVARQLFPPPETISNDTRRLLLTEGESDTIAATSAGYTAVGVPGTQGWKPEYAARFTGRHWTVYVVFDCDTVGRKAASMIAAQLVDVGVDARVIDLDPGRDDGYDLTDYLRQHQPFTLAQRLIAAEPYTYTPPADNGHERLRIRRIADVVPKRVSWLEPELIAHGMLTGLVAPGGTVKGLYGVHIAAKIAMRGERTLFLCSEDALDYIVRPRFQAAGCDGTLAYSLSAQDDYGGEQALHFPSDLLLLKQAIEQLKPTLVIIDPIASYIDPGLDMGKNNEMRMILQPLITLAGETDVSILVVYHLGKVRERGALGSVAFEDACRLVLTAARDDDDEDLRHVELTKSTITATGYCRKLRVAGVPIDIDGETVEVAKLIDEGRSYKSVLELLAKRKPPGPEPVKKELARELLVEALVAAGTPGVNADEVKRLVAKRADVSLPTVWRAFAELKADELVSSEPIRDEFGTILEWKWAPKLSLLVGRDAV